MNEHLREETTDFTDDADIHPNRLRLVSVENSNTHSEVDRVLTRSANPCYP